MAYRFDLDIIRDYIEEDLDDSGYSDKLEFEYEQDDEYVTVSASGVTLKNHDDDIYVEISAYTGGGCTMRAVFDKIDKTTSALSLLNDFNEDSFYFKAYIRDDGYLTVKHAFIVLDESSYKDCASEFLGRVAGLADNEILQKLTRLTH